MIPLAKFSINRFWEKTPNALKYILVLSIVCATMYFVFMKKVYSGQTSELNKLVENIEVTYKLIDNFEKFKTSQNTYNEELLKYMNNLYSLVQELNENTNKKLDIIIGSGSKNKEDIIEKIILLNESFEKLSKVYQDNSKIKRTYHIEGTSVD